MTKLKHFNENYLQHKINLKTEEGKKQYQDIYKLNIPFPHIVLDNIVKGKSLKNILTEFPKNIQEMEQQNWDIRNIPDKETKNRSNWKKSDDIPYHTYELLQEFNSGEFVRFIENITGEENLIPDIHFKGGGMSSIEKGGILHPHLDGNGLGQNLFRRVNLLLYLNENWEEEYGGQIDFFDKNHKLITSVNPAFNRIVIFTTDSNSWHGMSKPVTCPEGMSRKNLIIYYYTVDNRFNQNKNEKYGAEYKPYLTNK